MKLIVESACKLKNELEEALPILDKIKKNKENDH